MNPDKREIVGTVLSLENGTFWYNACVVCHTKMQEEGSCIKCRNTSSCLRYRLCLEVDSAIGLLHITIFGNTLNEHFGIDAQDFSQSQGCDQYTTFLITKAVKKYFVGHIMVFTRLHLCEDQPTDSAYIAESVRPLQKSSRCTVFEHFEALQYLGQFADKPGERKNPNPAEESTSDVHIPQNHASCEEDVIVEKSPRHLRSQSDSLLFLQDSVNVSLFNKCNWTSSLSQVKQKDMNLNSTSLLEKLLNKSSSEDTEHKQTPSSCELLDNITLPLFPSQDKLSYEYDDKRIDTEPTSKASFPSFNLDCSNTAMDLSTRQTLFSPAEQYHCNKHHCGAKLSVGPNFSTPKHRNLTRTKPLVNPFSSPVMFCNAPNDESHMCTDANNSLDLFSS